jgi:hypothetical protein
MQVGPGVDTSIRATGPQECVIVMLIGRLMCILILISVICVEYVAFQSCLSSLYFSCDRSF